MEIKKNRNLNNENLRFPIVLMAFLFVGGLLLASFTYTTSLERDFQGVVRESATEIAYSLEEKAPEIKQEAKEQEPTPPPQPVIVIIPPSPNPPKPTPPGPPTPPLPPPAPPIPPAPAIEFPDVEAMFPGGAAALQNWINSNVIYPETSIVMEDQGRVFLSFVVEVDGSITGIQVVKELTKELDREAKRVARQMPNWIPGEVAGKRVRTRCSLPIVFTLE